MGPEGALGMTDTCRLFGPRRALTRCYPTTCPTPVECPSPLDGLSCVRWGSTQKLSVGIIGGCLAGVMISVAITMALLKKQYKFKKIVTFDNPESTV